MGSVWLDGQPPSLLLPRCLVDLHPCCLLQVWSKSRAVPGEACEVSIVELPRLKASFVPKLDSDGVVRLYR